MKGIHVVFCVVISLLFLSSCHTQQHICPTYKDVYEIEQKKKEAIKAARKNKKKKEETPAKR